MTLRTPRRRISPRTKRRYRAIREFFRRAIGSSSQQDIQINSSIAVNVTDLKHKIVGIENQLNEVNRHCRDLVCLESNIRKGTEDILSRDENHDIGTINEQTEGSSEGRSRSRSSNTKVLYKNTDKSEESDYACNVDFNNNQRSRLTTPHNMNSEYYNDHVSKIKYKRNRLEDRSGNECDPKLRGHRAKSNFETFTSGYSTNSFHSLVQANISPRREPDHSGHRLRKQLKQEETLQNSLVEEDRKRYKQSRRHPESPVRYVDRHVEGRRHKRDTKLDDDFIADIIKRQYKPMKLFGRRQSAISQFSAPVCRDQEFSAQENILEGSELCSCCYEGHNRSRYVRNNDLSDMRSICDTRLYSSKRQSRNRHHRRHVDVYNDSTLYDLIPVKEKSSPKSRRKFVEDNNVIPYNYYKEVPPSPRTHRPRLNLKAQYYTESEDYLVHMKHPNRKYLPVRQKRQEYVDAVDSDITSEIMYNRIRKEKQKAPKCAKVHNTTPRQQDIGTMSSLQYPRFGNDQANVSTNDTILNKTQDSDQSTDKTDKALCEIKDILQNFLHEIKKDTSLSQPAKSDINSKTNEKLVNGQESVKVNAGVSGLNFNSYNTPPCLNTSFMPPFSNPCCYPMMPVCPMNCMQKGYLLPSPSFSCHACTNTQKDAVCQECSKNKVDVNETLDNTIKSNETEELIKEIYKFVAQSPNAVRKRNHDKDHDNSSRKGDATGAKVLTSRSVGGSSRATRRDANVGTPTMKCYSKSCEAIGSKLASDYSRTNATQSDTILEKLSLEATTQSTSDSDISTDSTVVEKKTSKFAKVLRSFAIFKKKKKDVIEELSESESSMEVDVKPKSPYRQQITNYMMHGQEYYRPPPVPPYQRPEAPYGYPPHEYDPRMPYPYPVNPAGDDLYSPHNVHRDTIHEHSQSYYHTGRPHPTPAPNSHSFDPSRNHGQPQGPLCLKEIEVKSTGTQSDRKISFFQRLAKPLPPRVPGRGDDPAKNCSTQTAPPKPGFFKPGLDKPDKGLFSGFKNLKAQIEQDPMQFSYKTQKKLAEGDLKMRNAVLKKLFYKRNPFSPRNLIVKTLLGKDKSSYGEPQMIFRPKMFF